MAGTLQDRVALVTGAASGIGRRVAEDFAREGARVCIADLDEGAARAAADVIRAGGGQAIGVRCDVTREPEIAPASSVSRRRTLASMMTSTPRETTFCCRVRMNSSPVRSPTCARRA